MTAPKPGKSLAEVNPKAASLWHPTMNGNLTPQDVTFGSSKRVWWKCPDCGREWDAMVFSIHKGSRCPKCGRAEASRKNSAPKPGKSLAEVDPDAAALWHPTMNGDLTPWDVGASSHTKVWWKCPDCGYEWHVEVCGVHRGTRCPECYRMNMMGGRRS